MAARNPAIDLGMLAKPFAIAIGWWLAVTVIFVPGCYNPPPDRISVWSEFLPFDDVRPLLPALAGGRADLYLAICPDDLNDGLVSLLNDAETAGVAVRPWLQLPEMGVWLNEDNVTAFRDFANAFLDWANAEGLAVWSFVCQTPPATRT